jgi:hypothetical protein
MVVVIVVSIVVVSRVGQSLKEDLRTRDGWMEDDEGADQ